MYQRCMMILLLGLSFVSSSLAVINDVRITRFDQTGRLWWTNATGVQSQAALSNTVYQIQTTADLSSGWQVLPGMEALNATNNAGSATVTVDSGIKFFRIAVTNPIVADAAADFSGVQGSNNWYYGYYDGTLITPWTTGDFKLMTNYAAGIGLGGSDVWEVNNNFFWTTLWPDGGHPNGTITTGGRQPVEQWAVRRWVSTVSGSIQIFCTLADQNPAAGNGVTGHIIVDGTEVANYAIPNGGQTTFSVVVSVTVGSLVDFAIDPTGSNDIADSTTFSATIQH